MAATAKQQTLDTVIENNQRLVQTNARLVEEIAALRALLEKEKKKSTNNNNTRNNNASGQQDQTNVGGERSNKSGGTTKFDPEKYCWTCGYRVTHNSDACKIRAPGHKTEATRQNTMGGSTRGAGFGVPPNGK